MARYRHDSGYGFLSIHHTDRGLIMGIVYSIHKPTFLDKAKGRLGDCITDGYDKETVIAKAINFFETKMIDDGEVGEAEEGVTLYSYDEDTDAEKEQAITLKISVEDDGYDHGRFDYNHSRL